MTILNSSFAARARVVVFAIHVRIRSPHFLCLSLSVIACVEQPTCACECSCAEPMPVVSVVLLFILAVCVPSICSWDFFCQACISLHLNQHILCFPRATHIITDPGGWRHTPHVRLNTVRTPIHTDSQRVGGPADEFSRVVMEPWPRSRAHSQHSLSRSPHLCVSAICANTTTVPFRVCANTTAVPSPVCATYTCAQPHA